MGCKLWSRVLLSVAAMSLAVRNGLAQKVKDIGPEYDVANQVKIKGVIEDIREIRATYGNPARQNILVSGLSPCLFFDPKEISRRGVNGDSQFCVILAATVYHMPDQKVLRCIPIQNKEGRLFRIFCGELLAAVLLRDLIGLVTIGPKEAKVENPSGGVGRAPTIFG